MKSRTGHLLLLGALLVAPVLLYAPLLDNGLIDDDAQYLWGARLHRLADLPKLLTMDIVKVWREHHYTYDAYAGGGDYRPVGYLYFALLHPFFGFHTLPYRVLNMVFFSLGTLLVLRLIWRLTEDRALAWLTAGLFAVEYVRIEYAFLLAFQGGLVLILYLESILAYLTARTSADSARRRRVYALSLLAALGAYFDHELAISLPLVLLWLEWFGGVLRRQWPFRPLWILPHGLLAGFYVAMRALVESRYYPEVGMLWLNLADPRDLLYATIHMVSRLIMLFVYNFDSLRWQAKVRLFGDIPGQTVLAAKPLLALGLAGVLVGVGIGTVWVLTRPRLRRYLTQEARGQWVLLACGWSVLALAPTAFYNGLPVRHLMIAAVGSDLLKATVIVAASAWLARWWGVASHWLAAGLLAPLVLYSVTASRFQVRAWDEEDHVNTTLIADAVRLVREAAVDDRPMVVYYLNGALGNTSAVAIQDLVQAVLGRDTIRVVVPYALPLRQALDGQFRFLPQVTINADEIVVVNQPEHPYRLGLVYYDMSAVRTGLEVQNGTLYTLEILEADKVNRNPLRLVVRYARPPGTRLLFLKFDHGRLVRQDAD